MDFLALRQWYQQLPGRLLLESERAVLNQILSDLTGRHILQIDVLNDERLLNTSPIAHKIRLNAKIEPALTGSAIAADMMSLPFLPNSVQAVILNHTLGYAEQPKLLLEEIDLILKPEGYLIIIGFNPFSLWGLIKLYTNVNFSPWQEKFIPITQIKLWLRKLGFSLVDCRTVFFRPPLKSANNLNQLSFMETIGQLYLPAWGASYILLAKKKRIPLTLMPTQLRRRKLEVNTGVLEPTTRV